MLNIILEKKEHFIKRDSSIVSYLAGYNSTIKPPRLYLDEEEELYGDAFWKKSGVVDGDILVGLHPFFDPYRERTYPVSKMEVVADKLLAMSPKVKIAVFWGPSEAGIMEEIKALGKKGILIEEAMPRQLVSLMKRLNLFICCDTGTKHLASSIDTPVVELIGATRAWETGAWGKIHISIEDPCRIAKNIEPEKVVEAAMKVLSSKTE